MTATEDDVTIEPVKLVREFLLSLGQGEFIKQDEATKKLIADKGEEFVAAGAMLMGIIIHDCAGCQINATLTMIATVREWLQNGIDSAKHSDALMDGDRLGCNKASEKVMA